MVVDALGAGRNEEKRERTVRLRNRTVRGKRGRSYKKAALQGIRF